MTDHEILQRQTFEHELARRGVDVTVKLVEGQTYDVRAIVGDIENGVVSHDGGVDEIPARIVQLLNTVEDGDETITLEFARGSAIVIDDVDWAVEKLEGQHNWGALDLLCVRSKLIDSAGRTNRRYERYGAGGRLRSRY